jgi:hypothetical protein
MVVATYRFYPLASGSHGFRAASVGVSAAGTGSRSSAVMLAVFAPLAVHLYRRKALS